MISQQIFGAVAMAQGTSLVSRAVTRAERIAAATINVQAAVARVIASDASLATPFGVIAPGGPLWTRDWASLTQEAAAAQEALIRANTELTDAQRTIADDVLDVLEKVLFESLKKKILDMVVDQIIGYIQGEGSPRFITDWQGFFGDIAQGAVGDLVQGLGLGFLCSPFSLPIRLQIAASIAPVDRFKARFSCTLDQVVGNIESFYADFRNGGWKAYDVAWEPQNNYYGSIYLAWDSQQNLIADRLVTAANEAIANAGYLGVRKCYSSASGLEVDTPPGGVGPGVTCSIVTPGKALGDLVGKAIGSDIDFLVNSEDLSTYIASIANALINRVIKEGVGLIGVSTPAAPQRIRTRNEIDGVIYDSANIPGSVKKVTSEYSASLNDQLGLGDESKNFTATATRSGFIEQLKIVRSIRSQAQTSLEQRLPLEQQLLSQLKDANDCLQTRASFAPHGKYSPASLPGTTKSQFFWTERAKIYASKIADQQETVDSLQTLIVAGRKTIDQMSAAITEIQTISDEEFSARAVTFDASAINRAITFKNGADNALKSAQKDLPPQTDSAKSELDSCVRGI